MSKTAGLPGTQGLDPATRKVLDPLIEVVEGISGRRPRAGKIKPLPANAALPDVIAKINELLDRIQS